MPLPAFLTPKRLQFRIVALFLGLLLVVQLASLLLIGNSISVNARSAVNAELRTAERVFERLLAQNAGRLTDAARLLASDFGFRAAVASNDGETLASALANQGDRIGASLAVFTDAQFRLKAATHDGAARFLPTLRQLATDPDVTQRLVMLDGEPYQLVAVPVKAPLTIGWVAMGFRIEAGLLQEMQQLSSIDVALLTQRGSPPRWEVLQSTLGPTASPQLVEQWLSARATQATSQMSQKDRHATLTLADDSGSHLSGHLLARDMPLGREGEPQTVAVLMRSLDEATAPYRRLQWLLLAFTVVAIALFAVVSVFTARRITTPLKTLAGSARRLGQGDYEQAVPVRTDDEIGELAQAFETMRLAVREREGEVRRLAFEDALTQLPNREQFRTDLRFAILHAQAHDEPCAVLMLDLDRFKHVNDVLGHRFGDRLLQEVAKRLTQEARRSNDVVARLGGDEFVMLMPGADIAFALGIAQRIQRAFERPISLDDHTVDLSAGIGIACCPAHGIEADALVSRAELAMYAAKQHQLGVKVYDAALDMSSDESLSLLSELRTAVDRDQLRLYLQPKISLATGAVLGAEALVRWQHPQRGLVPPVQFIPFAEQTGYVRQLTLWVFEEAARQQAALLALGLQRVSINLSTRDLMDVELPDKLEAILLRQQARAEGFCLEITEGAIMDDAARAKATLERLSQRGYKLSIDDFGTGYSSLAYLQQLPVQELKIDMSFVKGMEKNPGDETIVRSTIELAHNLGLSVVAEGVENAAILQRLGELGCDEAQGYHLSKPVPLAQLQDWAAKRGLPVQAAAASATGAPALH